jgi:hypothetical protein
MEKRYIAKREFLNRRVDIKPGQLTKWLFHRETNGLSEFTRKIGKTIFISEPGFDEWIDQYGKQV